MPGEYEEDAQEDAAGAARVPGEEQRERRPELNEKDC